MVIDLDIVIQFKNSEHEQMGGKLLPLFLLMKTSIVPNIFKDKKIIKCSLKHSSNYCLSIVVIHTIHYKYYFYIILFVIFLSILPLY